MLASAPVSLLPTPSSATIAITASVLAIASVCQHAARQVIETLALQYQAATLPTFMLRLKQATSVASISLTPIAPSTAAPLCASLKHRRGQHRGSFNRRFTLAVCLRPRVRRRSFLSPPSQPTAQVHHFVETPLPNFSSSGRESACGGMPVTVSLSTRCRARRSTRR